MSPPIKRLSLRLNDKSKAGAPIATRCACISLTKVLEQLLKLIFRHSDASIGNPEIDPGNILLITLNLSRKPDNSVLSELTSISDQINQSLPDFCCIRANKVVKKEGVSQINSLLFFCANGAAVAETFSKRSRKDTFSTYRVIFPASIFERSRTPLIKPSKCLPEESIFSKSTTKSSGAKSSESSINISLYPIMAFIGVRSS